MTEYTRTANHSKLPGECMPVSPLEQEIIGLIAQGFKDKEVAGKMFITEQSVKNHLRDIFDKLAVSDRLELVLYTIHKNIHTRV